MSGAKARRRALEQAAAARKHVVHHRVIGFTYQPTPPSGPPPGAGEPSQQRTPSSPKTER